MYQEAFEKLELDEVARILDTLNPLLQGAVFDPVETTIMAADMPFYPGCQLLDIANHSSMPALRRYAIYSPKVAAVLDFGNEVIYKFNETYPLKLNEGNVATYVRFFFTFVRGKHGRFIVTENIDDIHWKEDPPPQARQAIGRVIKPIILKEERDDEGKFQLEARMVFKNSLFRTDVSVNPESGLVFLTNEQLLVEDMPVVDDTFGQ